MLDERPQAVYTAGQLPQAQDGLCLCDGDRFRLGLCAHAHVLACVVQQVAISSADADHGTQLALARDEFCDGVHLLVVDGFEPRDKLRVHHRDRLDFNRVDHHWLPIALPCHTANVRAARSRLVVRPRLDLQGVDHANAVALLRLGELERVVVVLEVVCDHHVCPLRVEAEAKALDLYCHCGELGSPTDRADEPSAAGLEEADQVAALYQGQRVRSQRGRLVIDPRGVPLCRHPCRHKILRVVVWRCVHCRRDGGADEAPRGRAFHALAHIGRAFAVVSELQHGVIEALRIHGFLCEVEARRENVVGRQGVAAAERGCDVGLTDPVVSGHVGRRAHRQQ
eukprot:scaffold39887_cov63-Phaeocystis_antarctica.AAC.3